MSENSASAILHEQKLKLICDLFNSSANFGIDGVMDCTKRDPYRQSFNLSALFSKFESDMSSFIFCFTISINVFWYFYSNDLIILIVCCFCNQIWYGAVLRGDKSRIEIGLYSNIQERVVINTVPELKSGFSPIVEIGSYVTIGHGSRLTSCVIENYVSIGQGCVIPEGEYRSGGRVGSQSSFLAIFHDILLHAQCSFTLPPAFSSSTRLSATPLLITYGWLHLNRHRR